MTTFSSFARREQQITAVRLASNANVAGTYYNGPNNNGIDATLTIAASSLTIDSVSVALNDRVLLFAQTNGYENGIYSVYSIGSTVVLKRAPDFHVAAQMVPGYYIPVAAGTQLNGAIFGIIEPQVQVVGTNNILFVNTAASPDSVTLANNGLNIYNPAGTFLNHVLFTSAITADRNFSIVTGDAARTLTFTGNATLNQDVDSTASPIFVGVTLNNTGLHLLDTNASHDLIIAPGSDLTADRTFTLTTGDADRTLTMSGNATLNQDVSSAGSPSFVTATLGAAGLKISDTAADNTLQIKSNEDLSADRVLNVVVNDANRAIDLSADLTLSTYGATLIDDATNLAALGTLGLKWGDSDTWGGGGASFAFTCAGIVATDVVFAQIIASTNTVQIAKVVAGAGIITVTFSADPGAGTIVNFLGIPTV